VTAGKGKRRGLLALCLSGALLFSALGVWQIQRLAWKRDLISRVEGRVHAPPVSPPARRDWATLDPTDIEFRRVQVRGVLLHDRETLVDALTVQGAGYWVITPLRSADGIIMVNRGFVPRAGRDQGSTASGDGMDESMVTGLLRLPEPGGRLLRPNRPAAERWFSRDVAAIARRRGLGAVAPFFIDQEATSASAGPLGGMTIVRFRNAHLVYAVTWLALAAICLYGAFLLRRR